MWAGKAPNNRCKKMHEDWTRSVADSCPVTCDKCTNDGPLESCQDESGKHWIHLKSDGTKLRKRTCAQAAKKPNTWCKRKLKDTTRTVADICPETCKTATCQRPNVANAKVKCANEKTANTLPSYETTCTVTCADNYRILDHTNELVILRISCHSLHVFTNLIQRRGYHSY